MLTSVAQFTMKPGKVKLALQRLEAVRQQANREQPGVIFYLVHRILDERMRPTRSLLFYECYRDQAALNRHLKSTSWKELVARWDECFEGSVSDIVLTKLERIGGFVHLDVP